MRAALCILCAALLAIGGCDSQEAEHKKAERQARDEQDAKREAEKQARREAELALMSDPTQGPAELERRLMEWIDVKAGIGSRISDMKLTATGEAIDPAKTYVVGGWASVNEAVEGPAIYDLMEGYISGKQSVAVPDERTVQVIL